MSEANNEEVCIVDHHGSYTKRKRVLVHSLNEGGFPHKSAFFPTGSSNIPRSNLSMGRYAYIQLEKRP